MNENQPLAQAYYAGAAAYKNGEAITVNPYSDEMGYEWNRGYRVARQRDRFNKTIAARKKVVDTEC